MKCLSVSQPFALLMASGKKTVELRSWNTEFRGEFLIHAPLKIRKDDARRLKISQRLATGAIIGKAEIYDVKVYNTVSELKEDARLHFASNLQKKRYGFMIKNAKLLRIPIPCKGMLGFFDAVIPGKKTSKNAITADIIDEEYRYQWIGRH